MTFRSCAVSTGSSIIMIGGHNNDSTESLNIMLEMTKVFPKVNKSMYFSKRVIISITHVFLHREETGPLERQCWKVDETMLASMLSLRGAEASSSLEAKELEMR